MWFRSTNEKDVPAIVCFVHPGTRMVLNLVLFLPQGPPLSRESVGFDPAENPSSGSWRFKD